MTVNQLKNGLEREIKMLNAEKYRAEILGKDCKFGLSNRICKCCYEECATCVFSLENNPNDGLSNACTIRKVKWLLSEYKEPIKLSRLEHELLKFIDNEGYKYIARDNCGGVLFRYPKKPTKNIYGEWGKGGICSDLRMFNDLFQFVKWEDEEPISIEDVLNNCEVVNDAKK